MALSDWLFGLGVFCGFSAIIFAVRNARGIKIEKGNEKLFERFDFYKKKWRRKNLVKIIIFLVIIFIFFIIGKVLNSRWIIMITGDILIFCSVIAYDKMIAYAKEKALNGKGKE